MHFGDPAYTYVLKFPYANWKANETRLQRCLGWPSHEVLDDPSIYQTMPGQDSPAEQSAFLETRGPLQGYAFLLARNAYLAASSIFSQKQGKFPPVASIYAQCELGEQYLHVHLVLGGEGLNKYNAKSMCAQLAHKWLDNIQAQLEYNVKYGHTSDATLCNVLIDACYQAKRKCMDMKTEHCDILQYKSRSGSLYACRVDAKEYITNYLLCKNLKYFTCVDPIKSTPFVSYFPNTEKTYAATLVNGKWVDIKVRKQWLQQLRDSVTKGFEPVFSGDIFSDLPKVPKAAWHAVDSAPSTSRMTKRETLMLDCIDRCEKDHLLTYENLVNGCPDLVVMLESQPGGSKLIENILSMVHIKLCQKYTAFSYIMARYSPLQLLPENKAVQLFVTQGYNPWQAGHWLCCVLHKVAGKQNTISFYGPASTGKTNMAKAIVNAAKLYGCVNHQNKNFVFNDCSAKLVCWWEECLMHSDWVEQAKCILGGTEFRIDRKHRDSQLLPQTPLIISTNNDIYTVVGGNIITNVHSKPLRERVVQFNFMKQLDPTFGEVSSDDLVALIQACAARYTITLSGFCSEWDLEKVPNDFPLANFCGGHSQDFILYEHGLCNACGGYYPLETRDRGDIETVSSASSAALFNVPGEGTIPTSDLVWGCNQDLTDFDLSLLATPPNTKSERSTSTEPSPTASASTDSTLSPPGPSKPSKRKRPVRRRILFQDDWSAQPRDTPEKKRYEQFIKSITETTESESESIGLTPSQWGEMLGIITKNLEEEPLVLHCFETLSESEDNTD